ncbi:hypothetical protein Bbelb_373590 [Branchiostoma belcheri]|nr:hypothetical protein Bbelb_373590 [Branchiostoma belcheri]
MEVDSPKGEIVQAIDSIWFHSEGTVHYTTSQGFQPWRGSVAPSLFQPDRRLFQQARRLFQLVGLMEKGVQSDWRKKQSSPILGWKKQSGARRLFQLARRLFTLVVCLRSSSVSARRLFQLARRLFTLVVCLSSSSVSASSLSVSARRLFQQARPAAARGYGWDTVTCDLTFESCQVTLCVGEDERIHMLPEKVLSLLEVYLGEQKVTDRFYLRGRSLVFKIQDVNPDVTGLDHEIQVTVPASKMKMTVQTYANVDDIKRRLRRVYARMNVVHDGKVITDLTQTYRQLGIQASAHVQLQFGDPENPPVVPTREEYNTGYSVSPEVSARPRVGSPDGRRPEGDPTRGRAGTEGDAEYTVSGRPRVGSPDGRRPEGDPTRGRAGTEEVKAIEDAIESLIQELQGVEQGNEDSDSESKEITRKRLKNRTSGPPFAVSCGVTWSSHTESATSRPGPGDADPGGGEDTIRPRIFRIRHPWSGTLCQNSKGRCGNHCKKQKEPYRLLPTFRHVTCKHGSEVGAGRGQNKPMAGKPPALDFKHDILQYSVLLKVMINLYSLHMDPAYWPHPDRFDPGRFLDAEGNVVNKPESFMPFSGGRRVCLGEQQARMELFLFFSTLLQSFTFRPPEDAPPPTTEGVFGLTMKPHPFKLCAIPPPIEKSLPLTGRRAGCQQLPGGPMVCTVRPKCTSRQDSPLPNSGYPNIRNTPCCVPNRACPKPCLSQTVPVPNRACSKPCLSQTVPARAQNGTQPDCPEPCPEVLSIIVIGGTRHDLGQGHRVSRPVLSPQARFGTRHGLGHNTPTPTPELFCSDMCAHKKDPFNMQRKLTPSLPTSYRTAIFIHQQLLETVKPQQPSTLLIT